MEILEVVVIILVVVVGITMGVVILMTVVEVVKLTVVEVAPIVGVATMTVDVVIGPIEENGVAILVVTIQVTMVIRSQVVIMMSLAIVAGKRDIFSMVVGLTYPI